MSQVIVLSEDTEINGKFRAKGEFVAVPDNFDQSKIRRKIADTKDIEKRNKRDLAKLRIPKLLEQAPEATRDALRTYLGEFPNDLDDFIKSNVLALLKPKHIDPFIDALENNPGKIKRLLKNPDKIDQILKAKPSKPGKPEKPPRNKRGS